MIRLTNIRVENDIINCDVFPEDSVKSGVIKIDVNNNTVSAVLPEGYEWCKNHVNRAKEFLTKSYASNLELPKEKTIIWY